MSRVAALAALLGFGFTAAGRASVVPIANADEPVENAKATPIENERREELHRLMQLMATQIHFSRLEDAKILSRYELHQISKATKTVEWASRLLRQHPAENQALVVKLGDIGKSFRKSIGGDSSEDPVTPDQERAVRASLAALKSVCHQCHEQARREGRLHDYNEITPP